MRKDVSEYVELAIDTGFSHIDSSAFYANEESVGVGLKQSGLPRSELYITAKYIDGAPSESINTSLTKLGLEYSDLYLIHKPALVADLESTWKDFEQLKENGKTKSIGVCNFTLPLMQKLLKTAVIKPAVNQISFNPYNYAESKELIEYSSKHGILTQGFSSLVPITKYPGGPVDAPVAAAAKRLGITPTQVILSWVRSKGVATVTTSATREHLKQYLAVPDLPPLTEEEIAAIDLAGSKGPPTSFRVGRQFLGNVVLAAMMTGLLVRYLL